MINNGKITILQHPAKDEKVAIKEKYSWTVAFFGAIALGFRKQWFDFGLLISFMILETYVLEMLFGFSIPVWFYIVFVWPLFAIIANKRLIEYKIKNGWKIISNETVKKIDHTVDSDSVNLVENELK